MYWVWIGCHTGRTETLVVYILGRKTDFRSMSVCPPLSFPPPPFQREGHRCWTVWNGTVFNNADSTADSRCCTGSPMGWLKSTSPPSANVWMPGQKEPYDCTRSTSAILLYSTPSPNASYYHLNNFSPIIQERAWRHHNLLPALRALCPWNQLPVKGFKTVNHYSMNATQTTTTRATADL